MANITFTEVSGLNNSIFGKSQEPIKMFLEKRGEALEQNSCVKEIFSIMPSTHFGEKFTSMTAMQGFKPVGENGACPVDGMQESYSKFLENMTFKDSFSISREMIEDAKLMDLKQKPEAFIAGYYRTRENFGACLLGNAIQASSTATYMQRTFDITTADGQELFDTAHPSKIDSTYTQSNLFSDVFSADALAAAECQMQGFCGDTEELLDVTPDTIVIPNLYALKKTVFATIGADQDPATANNGFNFHFGRWNVIVWPYLNNYITAGTAPWILMDSNYNKTYGGAVWLDRTKLEVDSDIDKNTHANVWRGYSRFIAGFNDWRFALCGGVSTGDTLVSAG